MNALPYERVNTEQFVDEVRKYPFLYRLSHRSHKDSFQRNTVWDAIAKRFGLTSRHAKSKWKSLRDRYLREKKQYYCHRYGSGTVADVAPPKWKLYAVLQAMLEETQLNDVDVKVTDLESESGSSMSAPTVSDGRQMVSPTSERVSYMLCTSQIKSEMDMLHESRSSSMASENCVLTQTKSIENGKKPVNRQNCSLDKVNVQIVPVSESVNNTTTNGQLSTVSSVCVRCEELQDDSFHYFMYIMKRFRTFSAKQRRYARDKIDKVMNDAEDLET